MENQILKSNRWRFVAEALYTSPSHCFNFMPILQLLLPLIPIHCFSIVDCRNNSHEVPISTFDTSFDLGLIRGIFTPRDDVSYLMRWWCVHDLLLLLIVPFACKPCLFSLRLNLIRGKHSSNSMRKRISSEIQKYPQSYYELFKTKSLERLFALSV